MAAVLRAALTLLLLDVEAGMALAVAEVNVVLVVVVGEDDVVDVGAAAVGRSRSAGERKARVTFYSLNSKSLKRCQPGC